LRITNVTADLLKYKEVAVSKCAAEEVGQRDPTVETDRPKRTAHITHLSDTGAMPTLDNID